MAQQTAVEWLVEQMIMEICKRVSVEITPLGLWLIEQAKQMEKEQIIDSYKKGEIQGVRSTNNFYYSSFKSAEQYYNETYGKE